jgi:uncharacterized protein
MKQEPLNDAEFESLTNVLKRFGGRQAMDLEQLDGFLAAVICCPDEVQKFEYLPEIWGDTMINEDSFAAQPLLQDFLALIERHKQTMLHTLESGDVFTPLLLSDANGQFHGNDWAKGFRRGMYLRKTVWADLLDDDDHGGSLVPILALAHEHDPDPKMRPYNEAVSDELRESLIVGAATGVMNVYRYFRRGYVRADPEPTPSDPTYRRVSPKTGRNDPCPCGSGKKYKYCCAKVTLH